jgi:hypothetical protein
MKPTMPILFISVNVLSILDKALTWFGLQNSGIYEWNPLVSSIIGKFGLTLTMILYSLGGFVLFYIVYRIVIMKRLSCEKHNISPETFFLMLNMIFFLIVVNNIFYLFHRG